MNISLNDVEVDILIEGLDTVLQFAKAELKKKKPGSPGYKTVQKNISFCISAKTRLKDFVNKEDHTLIANEGELQLMYGGLDFMLDESDDVLKTIPVVSSDYQGAINTINLMRTTKEKVKGLMAANGLKPLEE